MAFGYRGKREWLGKGQLAGDGLTYGSCVVPGPYARDLRVIFSDGEGWEHVSVSTLTRTPNWAEMCVIKDLFWAPEDTVIQFHPPRSEYVNNHPFCLHLWRPIGESIALPPSILVGFKDAPSMEAV